MSRRSSADVISAEHFSQHVRQLRRARNLTQEALADRSGLSADSIRRLEHGSFSPSLDTLVKLCIGLDLLLSTFFSAFELLDNDIARELIDLLNRRSPAEQVLAMTMLRAMFAGMDGISDEDAGDR